MHLRDGAPAFGGVVVVLKGEYGVAQMGVERDASGKAPAGSTLTKFPPALLERAWP